MFIDGMTDLRPRMPELVVISPSSETGSASERVGHVGLAEADLQAEGDLARKD